MACSGYSKRSAHTGRMFASNNKSHPTAVQVTYAAPSIASSHSAWPSRRTPPDGIAGISCVCRIHGRAIYRALGAGDRRRRRIISTEVLMRRLLSLEAYRRRRFPDRVNGP